MNERIEFTSPHRKVWVEKQARLLRAAASDPTATNRQLAERFGVSVDSAREWLREAGLQRTGTAATREGTL